LGIGVWGWRPLPYPQSPIPNPQSPILIVVFKTAFIKYILKYINKLKNN